MVSNFLAALFGSAEFPPAVAQLVIDSYAGAYEEYLAKNETLGDVAAPLVDLGLSFGSLTSLLRADSPAVLNAILASDERREPLLREIPARWRLSLVDQLRYVNRPCSEHFFKHTLANTDLACETHRLAVRRLREMGVAGSFPLQSSRAPKVSSPKERRSPYEYGNTALHRSRMPDYTVVSLYRDHQFDGLRFLSPILTQQLGAGDSSRSLRAWELLFALLDGDPAVRLQTILDSALGLARAEDSGH